MLRNSSLDEAKLHHASQKLLLSVLSPLVYEESGKGLKLVVGRLSERYGKASKNICVADCLVQKLVKFKPPGGNHVVNVEGRIVKHKHVRPEDKVAEPTHVFGVRLEEVVIIVFRCSSDERPLTIEPVKAISFRIDGKYVWNIH